MTELQVPAVTLTLGAVLDAAFDKAGLRDFGDESFFEPLKVLLRSLDKEANLSAIGRYGQFTRIVDLLVNRLRIEDWLRRYPEILDEQHCAAGGHRRPDAHRHHHAASPHGL